MEFSMAAAQSEMETQLYSNCFLLGLDPAVLGDDVRCRSRIGLFRHSNSHLGDMLSHFLLCAVRGPELSAKDFAGVWPIYDSAQLRQFRRVVHSLITHLEEEGALQRSYSTLSTLANACGDRFVGLLLQLSAHALREVHKREFPDDVAANPLPPSLMEVITSTHDQNSCAAALLSVSQGRIALERRRFLRRAATAVRTQALWTSLAKDLTREMQGLRLQEACLLHQLELRSPQKGEESAHVEDMELVDQLQDASQAWESVLKHTEEHERLRSDPVNDLLVHRQHRYRIDGSKLRTAVDRGSFRLPSEATAEEPVLTNGHDDMPRLYEKEAHSQVDVAEILQCWTQALNRLHEQVLQLAKCKAVDAGAGAGLLSEVAAPATADVDNRHEQVLQATLTEHKQHLENLVNLVYELKEWIPGMKAKVAGYLREQVSAIEACVAAQSSHSEYSLSDTPPPFIGGYETQSDEFNQRERSNSSSPMELVPPSPVRTLEQLLSTSPISMEEVYMFRKRLSQCDSFFRKENETMCSSANMIDGLHERKECSWSLREAVREAAKVQSSVQSQKLTSNYKYAFQSIYTAGQPYSSRPIGQISPSKVSEEKKADVVLGRQRRPVSSNVRSVTMDVPYASSSGYLQKAEDIERSIEYNVAKKNSQWRQKIDRPASPPLLMDRLISADDSEVDLLAPISELDLLE